jgi:hypothetical protein
MAGLTDRGTVAAYLCVNTTRLSDRSTTQRDVTPRRMPEDARDAGIDQQTEYGVDAQPQSSPDRAAEEHDVTFITLTIA